VGRGLSPQEIGNGQAYPEENLALKGGSCQGTIRYTAQCARSEKKGEGRDESDKSDLANHSFNMDREGGKSRMDGGDFTSGTNSMLEGRAKRGQKYTEGNEKRRRNNNGAGLVRRSR